MKKTIKKIAAIALSAAMVLALAACGGSKPATTTAAADTAKTYKVGICNFVDDASLNQIIANIKSELASLETDTVKFEILEDNCNTDATVLGQIIDNFIAEEVDLMVGVATPVAMQMQAKTEENKIPVVFAAVSDPIGAGIVESLEAPGANITGTSDYLNTNAIMDIIFANDPEVKKVGLLYDTSQDSSTAAIADAKAYLTAKGIEIVEKNGTNTTEVQSAAEELVASGVQAVFTPSDNTIMNAELAIYETFAEAGVLHFAGADSFALNGAFLGFGVDYANLGKETGSMVADILINGKNAGEVAVKTFDNGTATVNTDICEAVGLKFDEVKDRIAQYCTKVESIVTAESFDDLEK